MTLRLAAGFFGLSVLATALLGAGAVAEKGSKQTFEVTTTEHVNFAPGGTIRLDNSYGHLTVEGWDSPEVAITVTKSTNGFYEPNQKAEVDRRFEQIRVATERRSDKELVIATTVPRRSRWKPPFETTAHEGVTLEYRIQVPRDSHLVVHHDYGYVWVSDVTGELEMRSHTGDMIVLLADPGPYSIDARTRLGRVASDYVGNTHYPLLVGARLADSKAQARRIYLRMGRGSITIKKGPPYAPFEKD
jgi:hypothetical protein